MRVLFINPPFLGRFSRTARQSSKMGADTIYFPLELAYSAAFVESFGYQVRLIDAPVEGQHLQGLFEDEQFSKLMYDFIPNLIVVQTSANTFFNDAEVCSILKIQFPEAFILMVGLYASAVPKKVLTLCSSVDAVAIREYDMTVKELLVCLQTNNPLSTVDGLCYRVRNKIVTNNIREFIKNLDSLPWASRFIKTNLNHNHYASSLARYPLMMMITSRGCPYKCIFCARPQLLHGRDYRARSPKNVAEEFLYISKNFQNVTEIGIEDDCFTIDKQRVYDICHLLINNKNKLKWYCNTRADIDYGLLKLMKTAGCRLLSVGFESGNQKVLNHMKKDISIEQYKLFVKDTKKAGILIAGNFMIGNSSDSAKILSETYKFSVDSNFDTVRYLPLYLHPGTKVHSYTKNNDSNKFSEWLGEDELLSFLAKNKNFTSEEIINISNVFERKYHFRFNYLLMKLWQTFSDSHEKDRNIIHLNSYIRKTAKNIFNRTR